MNPDTVLTIMHEHFPNADKLVNQLTNQNDPDWPSWCLLPTSGWQAIVAEEYRTSHLSSLQIIKSVYLAALEGWRYSHGIYCFSPAFYKKLMQGFGDRIIEANDFYALPGWAIYIETPKLFWNKKPLEGFWANLAWDINKKEARINLLLNNFNRLKLFSLPLISLEKIRPNSQNNSNLFLILLLIQYVCIHYKNFYSEHSGGHHPQKQQPKLYKGKMHLYPIPQKIIWKPFE